MKSPLVTILMPVYNGEKYLKDAVESILQQSYSNFEFLIINDGSTDGSETILLSYSDSRIKLVKNEKNIGLVNTLNKGIEMAAGTYIARMDCDDISMKDRLRVQVAFMEKHPKIAACGSFYNLLRDGKKAKVDLPAKEEEMKSFLVFACPMAHPTVMLRTEIVRAEGLNYRTDFLHAEDYDLWSRMSEFGGLANIDEVLLNYRVHSGQITENKNLAERKQESLDNIRLRHLKKIGLVPSPMELSVHRLISDGRKAGSEADVLQAEEWLRKIISCNASEKFLNEAYLGKIVLERWLRFCFNFYGGSKGFRYFLSSGLYKEIKLPFKQKLEFFRNLYNSFKRKTIK